MVRGEPTSGKTTFFKKICFDWASLHGTNQDTQSTAGLDSLKPYTLLIPVILKWVEPEAKWTETVQDQIGLSDKHKQTLEHLLETQPEKILFIFDGFDEYNEKTSKELTRIMMGKMFSEACCVITSRPEAVSRIKQFYCTYKEAELQGFSDKHIEVYIQKFFAESKEKGEELCKKILDEADHGYDDVSSYLLPLARNPGNLCMICILHKHDEEGRKISTSREQLYEEIVAFILSRWEKRYKRLKHKTHRNDILNKYAEILLKFGQLAYSYDENQEMKLNFTTDDVRIKVGEDAMDYGFLIKPRPMSCGSGSVVLFSHKTIQEYLAGYYIVHKEMESFKEKCKNLRFLRAEKSLMRFIMYKHLTPKGAAQFVKDLIKSKSSVDSVHPDFSLFPNPAEELLKYLLKWDVLIGYPHEVESEPVIITDKGYRYEYMFPSCVIQYKQNKAHQEYSKYIKINKQCVKINLPQIQDVQSLGVRGDGEFYISNSDVYVTCCSDCQVNLVLDAPNLQRLVLTYINKVGVLEVHGAHHRLQVDIQFVDLNGCPSRTGPWMTNLQSLTMRSCSLCDSDLSDLAACFRSCSHRIPQTSTGLSCFIYS